METAVETSNYYKGIEILYYDDIKEKVEESAKLKRRYCYDYFRQRLYGKLLAKVIILYGLKGTGKTTMMYQMINDMSEDDKQKTAFIRLNNEVDDREFRGIFEYFRENNIRYVFIENADRIKAFLHVAAIFSDMRSYISKIVFDTDNQMLMYLSKLDILYDRCVMIPTNPMTYSEYRYLFCDNVTIDQYMKRGGIFDDLSNNANDYIKYITSTFQQAFDLSDGISMLPRVERLCKNKEFDKTLNDLLHNFATEFIVEAIKDNDMIDDKIKDELLILSEALLIKNDNIDYVDNPDGCFFTERQSNEVKRLLSKVDIIKYEYCQFNELDFKTSERLFFTQPALLYNMIIDLLNNAKQSDIFEKANDNVKTYIDINIINIIENYLAKNIVLYETTKVFGDYERRYGYHQEDNPYGKYYLYSFGHVYNNKCDMVILYGTKSSSDLYCVISDTESVNNINKLFNEDFITIMNKMFGRYSVRNKIVLYNGPSLSNGDIVYMKIGEYLELNYNGYNNVIKRVEEIKNNNQ